MTGMQLRGPTPQRHTAPVRETARSDNSVSAPSARTSVAILGGGTAGIAVAAALRRQAPEVDVTLIDPAGAHYYQPGFTLVAGGVFSARQTVRPMERLIPRGVRWMQASVSRIEPEAQRLSLADESMVGYDFLVAAPGLEANWDSIPGLNAALEDGRAVSMYDPEGAPRTWDAINAFRGGRAIFTQPAMPIKCPGAPQKIVYMAADLWRKRGLSEQTRLAFNLATDSLFSVAEYVPTLQAVAERHQVNLSYRTQLVAIDEKARIATFERVSTEGQSMTWSEEFDLLHVVPPQRAPRIIRESPLADEAGWLAVDTETLRHKTFANVFAIGDAAALPTSKTAAAIRAQVPVVVANLVAAINGEALPLRYSGYASCPLITRYGRVVLAEFVYGRKLAPSLPWDSTKERRSAWWLKRWFLPWMYWKRLLRGVDLPVVARH